LCAVPPYPDLVKKLFQEYKKLKKKNKHLTPLQFLTGKGLVRERIPGLDHNLNIDPENASESWSEPYIQLSRFKPRGYTDILFPLVDFEDKATFAIARKIQKIAVLSGKQIRKIWLQVC
jgi:hypothetical protein